jgi:FAD/FMN-containing dehydrogenase
MLNRVYQNDASRLKGIFSSVVIPNTIQELGNEVKKDNSVTIRGAGTGFSGGCIPENDTVISMLRMNRVLSFDEKNKIIEVETGMILDDLNEYLEKYDLEFPIIPFSKNICTIGGMIANNSVGIYSLKYGKIVNFIESIKIINNKGEVEEKSRVSISDYCGLEGITGIIVSAKLKVIKRTQKTLDVISFLDIKEVQELIKELRLRRDVCMIKIIDKTISKELGFSERNNLIIGYESNQGKIIEEKSKQIIDSLFEVFYFLLKNYEIIEDIKIVSDKANEIIPFFEKNNICFFGDIGFGNIYLGLSNETKRIFPQLIEIIKKNRGKINSSFGIGIKKKSFLDRLDLELYNSVKKRNDPENKFNRGKIIDYGI